MRSRRNAWAIAGLVICGFLVIVGTLVLAIGHSDINATHEAEMPVVQDWTLAKAAIAVVGFLVGVGLLDIARRHRAG
jgi:hypothetical protein